MRKKIVMFFNKEKQEKDPFGNFGKKKSVYYDFFERGVSFGAEMYLASRETNYLGGLRFKDPLFFDGKNFKKISGSITADAIYDRSGGMKFPSSKISQKVLNRRSFKSICHDKNKMYQVIGQFMPKSLKIRNWNDLKVGLLKFSPDELVVIKPAKGLGGKGIIIDKAKNIPGSGLDLQKELVLQKFVDTSFGIRGLTKGRHDLRIIVVGGKVILAHLRRPKGDSYLANVAQGGSIEEIPIKKVPRSAMEAARKIQKALDKRYDFPIYSIDFGFEKETPYVFELNDQIGFPSVKMKSFPDFNEALIKSLRRIAQRK